jgi:hypothetical protein
VTGTGGCSGLTGASVNVSWSPTGGVVYVSSVTSGNICVNDTLNGNSINGGKLITALPNGATYGCGSTGTYATNDGQSAHSAATMMTTNDQITLAYSQSGPTTNCTWASGAMTMTCASLNSVDVGMTMTLNGSGATVEAVDYQTNTILLAGKTTGAGSGTSVSFSNGTFSGGGTINLSATYRGGAAMYGSDSQGIHVWGAGPFGYAVGYMADQVSSGDKLGQFILTSATCDSQQEPTNVCFEAVNDNSAVSMGSIQWQGGHVSNGPGTPFVVDTGGGSAAVVIRANFATEPYTGMLGSVISGKLDIGLSDEANTGPVLLDVSSAVSELHLGGDSFGGVYLGFANPGQGNVWLSGDTAINGASPGAHILQLYGGAGTYT